MLEWVEKIVVQLSVGIVMGLLYNSSLNGRNRFFFIVIEPISSFWAVIDGKWFVLKWFRLDEGGVEAGLTDQVVFDCEGEGSYVALIHSFITQKRIK